MWLQHMAELQVLSVESPARWFQCLELDFHVGCHVLAPVLAAGPKCEHKTKPGTSPASAWPQLWIMAAVTALLWGEALLQLNCFCIFLLDPRTVSGMGQHGLV